MTIQFDINQNKSYFISSWSGEITDDELLNSYKDFYEGTLWSKELNELADLSRADVSKLTSKKIVAFCEYVQHFFEKNSVTTTKTAVYAPSDLPFGLSRIYEAWSDESPENFRVYRDMEPAIDWLKSNK